MFVERIELKDGSCAKEEWVCSSICYSMKRMVMEMHWSSVGEPCNSKRAGVGATHLHD